jgi:hypothetical protein
MLKKFSKDWLDLKRDWYYAHIQNGCDQCGFDTKDIYDAYLEIERLQSKTEWFDCKDVMPGDNEINEYDSYTWDAKAGVFWCEFTMPLYPDNGVVFDRLYYDFEQGVWYDVQDGIRQYNIVVTRWHKMPEPPEEKPDNYDTLIPDEYIKGE